MGRDYSFKSEIKKEYFLKGKGDKCIILLHGFMENLTYWNKYSTELSQEFRVLSIDLLGHGKSENPNSINTMNNITEQVYFILEKENIKKGIFVGHSMGGYVALSFLKNYSEMMQGICLINSNIGADTHKKKSQRNDLINLIERGMKNKVINISIPNTFHIKDKKNIDLVSEMAKECSEKNIIATLKGMIYRDDNTDTFLNSKINKLILQGKYDNIIEPLPLNKYSNKNIEIASLDTGHMTPLEDYRNTLKYIKQFINEC